MDKIIYLLKTKNSVNEIGDPIKTIEKVKRYAEVESVRQSEVYQAAAVGLKAEIMAVIWKFEYNREMFFEYEGKNYKIIRTFVRKKEEKIELTGTSVSNSEVKAYVNTESN